MRLATKTALLPAQTGTESTLFGERDGCPTRAGSAVLGDCIVRVMRQCDVLPTAGMTPIRQTSRRNATANTSSSSGSPAATQRMPFFIEDAAPSPSRTPPASGAACLNEINYLKNRKSSLVREGYEAERRSRSDEALYAITTIRRSLSRYRMAVRALTPPESPGTKKKRSTSRSNHAANVATILAVLEHCAGRLGIDWKARNADRRADLSSVALRHFLPKTRFRAPMGALCVVSGGASDGTPTRGARPGIVCAHRGHSPGRVYVRYRSDACRVRFARGRAPGRLVCSPD
jgi:hypothetical protein